MIWVFAALVTPLLVAAETSDDQRKELKAFQVAWKTVAAEIGGMPLPKEGIPEFSIIIGPDGKSTGRMAKSEFQYTMSVNPRKKPKTMENHHVTGAEKGKKQYGIYRLEGDRFTICLTPAGSPESDRPKEFATKDTTNVVFVFERVKETEKP